MKRRLRLPILVWLCVTGLAACKERSGGTESVPKGTDTLTVASEVNDTLIATHLFSSSTAPDQFILILSGSDYSNAQVSFYIVSQNQDTLFARQARSRDLLDDKARIEEMGEKAYIRWRLEQFFGENSFSSPPYTLNDPTKDEFSGDLELWEEIKNDSSAWCFEFSLRQSGRIEVLSYSKSRDTILSYDCTP